MSTTVARQIAAAISTLAFAGCTAGTPDAEGAPGTSPEGFTGIASSEIVYFGGTEPFWGGEVSGDRLTYSTPDNPEGTDIAIERFAGQGGLAFSGTLDGSPFDMTVTPGECSDGMSDRTYPYTVTLRIGDATREGCAHTDRQPFDGPENP